MPYAGVLERLCCSQHNTLPICCTTAAVCELACRPADWMEHTAVQPGLQTPHFAQGHFFPALQYNDRLTVLLCLPPGWDEIIRLKEQLEGRASALSNPGRCGAAAALLPAASWLQWHTCQAPGLPADVILGCMCATCDIRKGGSISREPSMQRLC